MDLKNVLFLAVLLRFNTFAGSVFKDRRHFCIAVWEVVHGCVLVYSLQFTLYYIPRTVFRSRFLFAITSVLNILIY